MISLRLNAPQELGKQKRGAAVRETPSAGPRLRNFSVTNPIPALGNRHTPDLRPLVHYPLEANTRQRRQTDADVARSVLHGCIDIRSQLLSDRTNRDRHSAFASTSFCFTHATTITRTTGIASKECMFIPARDARKARRVLPAVPLVDASDLFGWVWHWRARLPHRKGHSCRVLVRGGMNSVMVEFTDGVKVVTSRYAIRKQPNKFFRIPCL